MKYLSKKNRAIIRQMVLTDFKVRYQGSVLGYVWSLLKPLLQFAILYVVFVYIFKLNRGVEHFPAYLLLGIVLWNFFTEATSTGMGSIVSHGDLIRKISISRFLVVVSSSISALINLALNMVVLVGIALINGVHPSASWLLMVPLVIELYIFSQAVALILSAMYVKFRDVNYIWEVLIQAAFYGTPILYAMTMVPIKYQGLVMINPMAQIIQDSRYAMVTKTTITGWHVLNGIWVLAPILLVFIIAVISMYYFKKESPDFAENI